MTRFIIIAGLLMFAINAFTQIAQTGQKGLLRTHSAQTLGKGVLGVNTAGYFSFDKDYVLDLIEFQEKPLSPGDTQAVRVTSAIDPTFVSTYYNLSYGLFNFWDISLGLPFYIDKTSGASGSDNGPGDMTFSMKINYPPYEHFRVFDMTYYGCFFIPTGHQDKGLFPRQPYYSSAQNIKPTSVYYRPMITNLSDSTYGLNTTDADTLYRQLTNAIDSNKIAKENFYYGAGYLSFLAKMLWTFDASEINPDVNLKMHFNFGALFTGRSDKDNIFELGSAIEWSPHPVLTLFTDFYGQARFSQLTYGFDLGKEPLILGSGMCINIPGGAHITVALDKCFSLNKKYQTIYYNESKSQIYKTKIYPEWGLSVSANWSGSILGSDSDKDGIPDKLDRCPDEAEDVDNFDDQDGCPDVDNDRDGILDIRDKCPNKAEDMDNFEDNDGCPDIDNDKDGIPDDKDKCPNDAEDRDGFEDADGCPDLDNDKDGILDAQDKCPSDPEDVDGFEDTDGCPDIDNDQDGIPDDKDKCPTQKENINDFQDTDGCPDVKAKAIESKVTLSGVNFMTGSAELTYESGSILDEVVTSLNAYPDVCIEIRGHTDNVGSRVKNKDLSLNRANSVKAYLVSKGVAPTRVKTDGFGPKQPIASNTTEDGKAKNRRIEMYRINCK
ncbi:MAG: hypothetical protein A2268_05440 [Candidatus Raymondbacteria bacterium RifOxyA12_full_50_37]|uniref:OmpA-like domain-containing protein n=1 Tax=Candidatus Raymondbacteria bacterium RIFOXYD12_FULL_49_13 TaxID=1817890 RepID=A0A1F7FBZ3_UNCRA|nr:MAG: hypothetical protein A2268_05440 [Candidatus Raymondbacteria bacterium RifOxyA12_full_50_37]OGJ89008.1 MAG: hypothetical protein A2248_02675 [Candidatus Raymondbacteria bacterium RIFOXYA2_FULL_49_16]OGJ97035.1 MAG: hypothetical protein A2453_04090 [Candidatus Raymondbacteria bacterium RIFOXYC2_FULL_50_21]OGK04032.1 MAG: hypothetical protein A2519_00830 [Candidatus Raymondbacteria bacterium RIFOXYD12_FULL_49_13]OGP42026.1 MAG: hypothetical protein A2324_17850 [Candidatus Raymondbacteria 